MGNINAAEDELAAHDEGMNIITDAYVHHQADYRLRKALSERLKAGDVVVVDDLKLDSPKTKDFVGVLSALDLKGTALIVSQEVDKNLSLASRNVENVTLATSDSLNTYDVLRSDKLVFTKGAFEKVEARLAKDKE